MSHDTILRVLDEHVRLAKAAQCQADADDWGRLYDAVHEGLLDSDTAAAASAALPPTPAQLARDTSPTGRTPDSLFDTLTGSTVGQWLNLAGARIDVTRISGPAGSTVGFFVSCNGCENPGDGHNTVTVQRRRAASSSEAEAVQLAMDEAIRLGRAHAAVCDEVSVWVRGAAA